MVVTVIRKVLAGSLLLATTVLASPAERLAEAVRFKTISYQDIAKQDSREFQRFHQFLRESYPRVFSQLSVEVVNDYSLLIQWRGENGELAPVLFTAHMDVVPVEPGTLNAWQYPPFAGVIANGHIYGRGTLDDKQGLLGLLEAAEQLLQESYVPQRTVVFAFGHDEEVSGTQGAAKLAGRIQELGLRFEWVVDEGGFLVKDHPLLSDQVVALVNTAEKGYLTLTLAVEGEGGHSANPPEISTIGRLANAVAAIEAAPFSPKLVEPVRAMLEALAPHVGQPERFLFSNLWLGSSLITSYLGSDNVMGGYVRTTGALTMFNAGIKENVVPQKAEAVVNFRLLPGDSPEKVVEAVEAIIDDPLVKISIDSWGKSPSVADHNGSGFGVIEASVQAIYPGVLVVPSLLVASTDMRHYVDLADNHYRFNGILVDVEQISAVHGTNEYLSVVSYEKSIDLARQMIARGSRR